MSVVTSAPTASAVPPYQGRGVTSRWSLVWRYGLCVINLAFNLLVVVGAPFSGDFSVTSISLMIISVTLGLAVLFVMRLRWRHPLGLLIGLCVLACFSSAVATPGAWALIHLATRRQWREIAIGMGAVTVSSAIYLLWRPDGLLLGSNSQNVFGSFTFAVLLLGSVVGGCFYVVIGLYVGARRDLLWTLQDRAETAEREQESRVLQGQADERNRIAREMHDVLAHRLSLVSMHAGAMAYRDNLSTEETREIAAVIQENAHASLNELRGVLGALRTDDINLQLPPDKPQPTLNDLDGLVADAKTSGQKVDLRIETEHLALLPSLTGRHAYRMVQEGLTNARKHAPHTLLTVTVSGAPGEGLTILMSNPVTLRGSEVPGARLGLVGLAERAAVTGGRIEHGVSDQGTFDLKVWLPW